MSRGDVDLQTAWVPKVNVENLTDHKELGRGGTISGAGEGRGGLTRPSMAGHSQSCSSKGQREGRSALKPAAALKRQLPGTSPIIIIFLNTIAARIVQLPPFKKEGEKNCSDSQAGFL